uniref:TNFAIP3 interacting protein 3 n=1 Tax=Anser cygnoides TaxID=8845 RepID=A0A8B9ECT9_ANSCY
MIHSEQLKRKNKEAEDLLESCLHQCGEMERCESKELDAEIRNLIEKSSTFTSHEDPEPVAQESPNHQRASCSLKTRSETNAQGRLGCTWADVSEMEAPADLREKETKVLSEVLHDMKEENKLLKQKNASMIRKQEHYECEISRLNKALKDVLQKKHQSVPGTPSEGVDKNSLEDMRTQLEVLRQQVQIYEEDFRKERSDRERLNEEKEALQKINERLQSQLNKLNSQIKTCVKGKEKLEKQLQQQTKDLPVQSERPSYPPPLFLSPCVNYGNCGLVLHYQDPRVHPMSRRAQEQQQHSPDYQWYVPDQFPPDVQHKANDSSSEKGAHH